jgi:hypothetical protein
MSSAKPIAWRRLVSYAIFIVACLGILHLLIPQMLDTAESVLLQRLFFLEDQLDSEVGRLRLYEMNAAIKRLADPAVLLWGIGYAGAVETYLRHADTLHFVAKQYIHNYHLLVLVKGGIFMFVAYIAVFVRTLALRPSAASTYALGLIVFLLFQPIVFAFHLFALLGFLMALEFCSQRFKPAIQVK